MSDIGFMQNFTNIYMINITPDAATKTWARIAAGIKTVTPSPNEVTDQTAYYDGEGMASTDVTGGQLSLKFDGNRKIGDTAQDWVASIAYIFGDSRKTDLRWVCPDGRVLEGKITVKNINDGGGDANSKGSFSFETDFNGLPSVTAGEADTFPTSITAPAVTVKVGATAAVSVTVTPTDASTSCVYAVDDDSIATVAADGTVTGVKAGTAHISVKSAVKPSVTAVAEVTVTAA